MGLIRLRGHRMNGEYGVRHGRGEAKKQRRKRRRFTDEFKGETVKRVLSGSKTAGQVARELDPTETALLGGTWLVMIVERVP